MERKGGGRPTQYDHPRHHGGGRDVAGTSGKRSGGSSAKTVLILANHFPVVISFKEPLKYKGEASVVAAELLSAHLGSSPTASDGQKNVYSTVHLTDTEKLNEPRLSLVDDYIQGRGPEVPREVMQAVDMVLIGRYFHSKDEYQLFDLKKGGGCFLGSAAELKQGLILCLYYSVIPFFKPLPLLDFLNQYLRLIFNPKKCLTPREKDWVSKALRGVKVRVSHR